MWMSLLEKSVNFIVNFLSVTERKIAFLFTQEIRKREIQVESASFLHELQDVDDLAKYSVDFYK
jgi:hypothetical protein